MTEIERKFLLDKIPKNIYIIEKKNIEQFYLCLNDGFLTRVRKTDNTFNIGFKLGMGIVRLEKEISITEQDYNDLVKFNPTKKIAKFRHIYKMGDYKVEIDEFRDNHKGLIIAEIEFENLSDAKNFIPPKWFGKEVTEDGKYTNVYLSGLNN